MSVVNSQNSPTTVESNSPVATQQQQQQQQQVNLLGVNVTNENDALNVMVGFLGLAQKRGAFAINESAKIFECIKKFQPSTSS
jgi:hypothetical protein